MTGERFSFEDNEKGEGGKDSEQRVDRLLRLLARRAGITASGLERLGEYGTALNQIIANHDGTDVKDAA